VFQGGRHVASVPERDSVDHQAESHPPLDGIDRVEPRPPVLWVRGEADLIVSDTSARGAGLTGRLTGAAAAHSQPDATRADRYAAAWGSYREVVIADAGHSPHLERPEEFPRALSGVLSSA
jgi:pimeloyl-ACP methyl ester carboxylesterase